MAHYFVDVTKPYWLKKAVTSCNCLAIYRNPLEAGIKEKLERYPWSSYVYYLGKAKPPQWLYPQEVLAQLNTQHHVYEKYQSYVAQGVDEELKQFYNNRPQQFT
jgi:hypothetical protein